MTDTTSCRQHVNNVVSDMLPTLLDMWFCWAGVCCVKRYKLDMSALMSVGITIRLHRYIFTGGTSMSMRQSHHEINPVQHWRQNSRSSSSAFVLMALLLVLQLILCRPYIGVTASSIVIVLVVTTLCCPLCHPNVPSTVCGHHCLLSHWHCLSDFFDCIETDEGV